MTTNDDVMLWVRFPTLSAVQVVGHKEGLDVMERADPLFLLIGLPTIPVMLILGKMIRWEDYVLRLWRKYSNKLQILNSIFPGPGRRTSCHINSFALRLRKKKEAKDRSDFHS